MGFIQIIEYETDRFDEIRQLADERRPSREDAPGFVRLAVSQDRDNPRRYVTIIEFDSYESAMDNSNKPETGEFAARLASLCSSPPRFHNLDVLTTEP